MTSEFFKGRTFLQTSFRSRIVRSCFRIPVVVAGLCLALGICPIRAQVTPSPHQQAVDLYQAGLAQVRSGHVDEAIRAFKNGLAIEPQDARLLDATGAAYSLKGDLDSARQYFVDSLRIDPNSVPTKQNLGITLFSLARYEDASKQFKGIQGVAGQPRVVASLFLGLIAEKQSDCKRALPLLEAADSLLYQYQDAVLSFSECAYQEHDTKRAEEALAAFDRLSGTTPSEALTADVVLKRARLLEKMNRHEEAQKLLEVQSASHPTFDLLLMLSNIAKNRGDFPVAMKSLKRAAELEPGREDSYLEFSTICADHGNDQLALESAEIGLDHVPDSYRLMVQKGVAQEKLGNFNDAEETLRKASGLQKDNSIALLSIAVVQAHNGRPDEAKQTLANAIRQFPDNYYMYYFQGKLLLNFANSNAAAADLRASAERSLEKAIQLNPEYADSYYQLSSVYLTSAPTLAEQALHKCLQLDPNHLPAQYSLARLYVRTGRKAQGEALLARFKTQQRTEELQQQKQLRIEVATN
jgi:tetratricopeptide (TPR) repeat protein